MLSKAHQFLFIHVPKTGGNAIQNALLPFSEDKKRVGRRQDGVERFDIRSSIRQITKHSSLSNYAAQLDQDTFRGLFKFAVVRNPWDRCISHYFAPYRGTVVWDYAAFETFVREHVYPLEHYLRLSADDPMPQSNFDFILRFEDITADFMRLVATIDVPAASLKKVNVSKRRHYASYYDDRLCDLVAQKFKWEIDQFGYCFEGSTAADIDRFLAP